MTLTRPEKDTFHRISTETEGRGSPSSTSAGKVHTGRLKFLTTLHLFTGDQENTANISFGVTNNVSISKFAHTKSMIPWINCT